MMNIMNPPADWSTLKKLIWLRGTPINGGEELTVSGTPPLSLPNSLGKPLKAWEVDVVPKQNLNGYDAPWPAGGGKNKFDGNLIQGGVTPNGPNPLLTDRVRTDFIPVVSGSVYTFSATLSLSGTLQVSISMYKYNSDTPENWDSRIKFTTFENAPVTFTVPSNANYCVLAFRTANNDNITPSDISSCQLELGSTATSYAPYSNICPIHGTDKLTIYTDSKYGGLVNWNQMIEHGNFDSISVWGGYNASFTIANGIATVSPTASISRIYQSVDIVLGHKYLMCAEFKGTRGNAMLSWYGGINQFVPFTGEWQDVNLLLTNTFQTATNWQLHYGSTSNSQMAEYQIKNAMCFDLTQMFGAGNEPKSVEAFRALFPNDYYAYNAGQQMTVDQVNGAQYSPVVLTLPQTVYTGTIGSEGGESRTRYRLYNGDASEQWTYSASWSKTNTAVFYSNVALTDALFTNYADTYITNCNLLPPTSRLRLREYDTQGIGYSGSFDPEPHFLTVRISKTIASTVEEFTAFLASNPLEVVYMLNTPVQIPLTTPTIPTPTGTATTWATAEDGTVESMEVTYVGKA